MFIISHFTTASGRQPVEEFIEGENRQARDKLREVIEYLREYGFHLPDKYLRRMTGTKHLWELRVKHQKQYRIFLARIGEQEIVLLHAIIKKRQKTPEQDIRTAEERLRLLGIG
jgi:phage-related protein